MRYCKFLFTAAFVFIITYAIYLVHICQFLFTAAFTDAWNYADDQFPNVFQQLVLTRVIM